MILGLKQSVAPLLPFGRRDEGGGWLGRVRIWELDNRLEDGGKGLVWWFLQALHTGMGYVQRNVPHIYLDKNHFLNWFPISKIGNTNAYLTWDFGEG